MGGTLDLLGSYIIGGLVLMMMTAVIINLQDSARDTMVQEISQLSLAEMSQTMEREMSNMGHRVYGSEKVLTLTNQTITFLSDFDNNGVIDTISYAMQNTLTGPNVRRSISRPGSSPLVWSTRGSIVLFTGFDANGTVSFDPTKIRAVEASMLTSNLLYEKLQDGSLLGATGTSKTTTTRQTSLAIDQSQLLTAAVDCEAGAYWHKVIYPRNLSVDLDAAAVGGN
ncbi:MAG: hypothetical protein WC824_11775 [Bacteroidota bacterium]|jgi:hypothetical protein